MSDAGAGDVESSSRMTLADGSPLPYKIAVLCYVFDEVGRVLLLHRRKRPNPGMYSPIGGKLEVEIGEIGQPEDRTGAGRRGLEFGQEVGNGLDMRGSNIIFAMILQVAVNQEWRASPPNKDL